MRVFAFVCSMIITAGAFAEIVVDPFDGKSCSGTMMSAGRALDLLGPDSYVNLATKAEVPASYLKAHYRFRNKIGGRKGPWFASLRQDNVVAPVLANTGGKLNFVLSVDPTSRDSSQIKCDIQNAFEMNCVDSQSQLSNWGNGSFWGVITDKCVRLKSERSSVERDEEWVYFMQIM
jgi:hypothetical protein